MHILLKTGLIGSAITALCCFTPALVILLSVLGLGALAGYLDYVLLPSLAVFLGIAVYALIRTRSGVCNDHKQKGGPRGTETF